MYNFGLSKTCLEAGNRAIYFESEHLKVENQWWSQGYCDPLSWCVCNGMSLQKVIALEKLSHWDEENPNAVVNILNSSSGVLAVYKPIETLGTNYCDYEYRVYSKRLYNLHKLLSLTQCPRMDESKYEYNWRDKNELPSISGYAPTLHQAIEKALNADKDLMASITELFQDFVNVK